MTYIQLVVILVSFIGSAFLLNKLLLVFGRTDLRMFFVLPMFAYCLGFTLRLSGYQPLIDLGYFFTEGVFLVVYSIFSIVLLLGQVKYWKK